MNKVQINVIEYKEQDHILTVEFVYPDDPTLVINKTRASFNVDSFNVSSSNEFIKIIAQSGLSMLQQELDIIRIKNDTAFFNSIAATVGQTYSYTEADFPLGEIPRKWDGLPISGEILLWGEQGLGEEILYSSLFPLILERGVSIAVSADIRLKEIYERSFPTIRFIDSDLIAQYDQTTFSAHQLLTDLGEILNLDTKKIQERHYPYLISNLDRRNDIKSTGVFTNSAPVCGIAWKSSSIIYGENKSVLLKSLAPLITIPDISFVNLQYGDIAEEIEAVKTDLGVTIHQVDGLDVLNDIDGLLALIDACDIVFTISATTAHLAGAIGKKAVVMVPYGRRNWYWNTVPNNLWYPSLYVVVQEEDGSWNQPILEATEFIRHNLFDT